MSAIKKLIKAFHEAGLLLGSPSTVEHELEEIGLEMERRRRNGISIHDGGFSVRLDRAMDWALASGFSTTSINHCLDEGLGRLTQKGR